MGEAFWDAWTPGNIVVSILCLAFVWRVILGFSFPWEKSDE